MRQFKITINIKNFTSSGEYQILRFHISKNHTYQIITLQSIPSNIYFVTKRLLFCVCENVHGEVLKITLSLSRCSHYITGHPKFLDCLLACLQSCLLSAEWNNQHVQEGIHRVLHLTEMIQCCYHCHHYLYPTFMRQN